MDGSIARESHTTIEDLHSVPLETVLSEEVAYVRGRKKGREKQEPLVALALSGGGVRSATVSMGFLQALHEVRVLPLIDYSSTVSGGSYAGGYLLSALKSFSGETDRVFDSSARAELVKAGRYLATGRGVESLFRTTCLVASVISTAVLNLAWIAGVLLAVAVVVRALLPAAWAGRSLELLGWVLVGALVIPAIRLATLSLTRGAALATTEFGRMSVLTRRAFTLTARAMNVIEGLALVLVVLAFVCCGLAEGVYWAFSQLPERFLPQNAVLAGVLGLSIGLVIGLLVSSDVIGLNAVFRELIDSAYLSAGARAAGGRRRELLLRDVDDPTLPYPLFNAGLYLGGETADSDVKAKRTTLRQTHLGGPGNAGGPTGAQVMDYFLFSPRFCGSASTHFARTAQGPYARTTLADAIACSAASISPLMDGHQNVVARVLFFLLNLNLGVWLPNPRKLGRVPLHWFRFWPFTYSCTLEKADVQAGTRCSGGA